MLDASPAVDRRTDRATINLGAFALTLQPANRAAFAPFAPPPTTRTRGIHWRKSRGMTETSNPAAKMRPA